MNDDQGRLNRRCAAQMVGDRTLAVALGLGVGILALWFRNQWMTWDALSLLSQLDRNPPPDAIHLLYVPLLRALRWVAEVVVGEAWRVPDSAQQLILLGQLVSVIGAGLAIAYLYRILRSLAPGAPRILAVATTLAVATAPPFVKQASAVEVYAPALGLSMVALYQGIRATKTLKWRTKLSAYSWIALAGTMHLGALVLLPLLLVMGSREGLSRKSLRRGSLTLMLAVGGLLLTSGLSPAFASWVTRSLHYVEGFLPSRSSLLSSEIFSTLDFHFWKAGRFFFENATSLAWLIVVSAGLWLVMSALWRERLSLSKRWLLWPLVPLTCYLALGVPLLGLLLHALVGSSVVILGAGLCLQRFPRLIIGWGLIVLLVSLWQCQQVAPGIWERRYQEDPLCLLVKTVEESLPDRSALIAGTASRHFEWWSHLPKQRIVALPDALHQGKLRTPPVSALEVFLREVHRLHDQGFEVLVTHSGLECLHAAGASVSSLAALMASVEPVYKDRNVKIYAVRGAEPKPK